MNRFSTFTQLTIGLLGFALLGFSGAILRPAVEPIPIISLHPVIYKTQSGSTGGQPVSNLNVMDESGIGDHPSRYVTFATATATYQGYRRYILPRNIPLSSITNIRINVNYKGYAAATQTWSWYLYEWQTQKWIYIGNNKSAIALHWTLLTFGASSPQRFINSTTRELRVLLRSNNAKGSAKLDYESITLGNNVTPTQTLGASATATKTRTPTITSTPTITPTPTITLTPSATPSSVHFAVIGDYGINNADEAAVATLVKSWNPDFVLTTGDNNYPAGDSATIDQSIGKYYHAYIYPYNGAYGTGSVNGNQFFPSLGNHDWDSTTGANPYLAYFTLPGNERYYEFGRGPVHFFVIDSDPSEPDGTSSTSVQALWLQTQLAAATEPWKIVYFHHPSYSSSSVHGSTAYMQWDFKGWGASAVLNGHDHTYERLDVGGFPYFVNGLGGQMLYAFGTPVSGSQVRYNAQYGAMLIDATAAQITFQFIGVDTTVADSFTLP